MKYIAHIRSDNGLEQTADDHNRNTGSAAGQMLSAIGLEVTGTFTGSIHDIGKLKEEFDDYIRHGGVRGSVNHTFAAVRWLLSEYHQDQNMVEYVVAEILAVATGAHHGLYDAVNPEGKSGFYHRLDKQGTGYDEVICNLGNDEIARMRAMFQQSVLELEPLLMKIKAMADMRGDCSDAFYDGEVMFYTGLLARVILSAVVDADRRDTAAFMNDVVYPVYVSNAALGVLWDGHLCHLEQKLEDLPCGLPIDIARREISDICKKAAMQPPGVFRMHVPTGGGKTLASLRFAIAHAKYHHMRRIVFTAPLLTIIDQNAQAMREVLPSESDLLECHSNVTNLAGRSYQEQAVLSEGWDAPIIVTTVVQFLDALFDGGMSSVRRMHALGRSVIVLDEVQTIPTRFLTIFSLALNFLVSVCRASVVLCSATQPYLQGITHSLCLPVYDIPVPVKKYESVFRRTELVYDGVMDKQGVIQKTAALLDEYTSVLVVCNTKAEAAELAQDMRQLDAEVFHLSANMCQAHRDDVLSVIKEKLVAGVRLVCVSTTVIEAGVDVSFGTGIRFLAGLDRLIQGAGRINRNGERGIGCLSPVHIIQYQGENLSRLKDLQMEQAATLELFAEFDHNPEQFDGSLDSDAAIQYYYQALYKICDASGLQDYPLASGGTLYDLLSCNHTYCKDNPEQYLRQSFATAGDSFTVFGNATVDLIVDYGEGKELILELNSQKAHQDLKYAKMLLRKARRYSVSVFRHTLEKLGPDVIELPGGALGVLHHYDKDIGLVMDAVPGSIEDFFQ